MAPKPRRWDRRGEAVAVLVNPTDSERVTRNTQEPGARRPARYWGSAAAVSLPATTGTISNSIRWDQLATQRCRSVTSSHSMS